MAVMLGKWLYACLLGFLAASQPIPSLNEAHAKSTPPAAQRCSQPTEFVPAICQWARPIITAIHVALPQPSLAVTDTSAPECRSFRPSAADIQRFFAHAGSVDKMAWLHKLDWTACQASGTAELGNGKLASWTVSATRMGRFQVTGEPEVFLYCLNCHFTPFWP